MANYSPKKTNGNRGNKGNSQSRAKGQSGGKRQSSKMSRRSPESSITPPIQAGFNDVSWYSKNDAILRDAASFSFNTPLGAELNLSAYFGDSSVTADPFAYSVPGVASIEVAPTIGKSRDTVSPVNLAAQNIYSFIRYTNSGATNYDAPDLMLYLLAMDSIYSFWNFLKRAYGCLTTYSQYNKYMPRAYFQSMGLDFDDAVKNSANFREQLNRAAAQIRSFNVPAVMPYFLRHSWLYSNIYLDSSINRAQTFIFNPAFFYKYAEVASPKGGSLVPIQWSNREYVTISSAFLYLQNMIDALAYSEDIGVMSGDILKAYGEGNLFTLTPVDVNYQVLPAYNQEVLTQIHNMTIIPASIPDDDSSFESFTVTQDPNTNFLICDPTLDTNTVVSQRLRGGIIVNLPWDGPTPADTMVATRLSSTYESGADSTHIKLKNFGSEVVVRVRIYSATRNKAGIYSFNYTPASQVLAIGNTPTTNQILTAVRSLALSQTFDWFPLIWFEVYDSTSTPGPWRLQLPIGDFANYTVMSDDDVERLHSTALLSEFNVPQLGSF